MPGASARRVRRPLLTVVLLGLGLTGVAAAVCVAVAAALAGGAGALGGLVGLAVAAAFFLVSKLALAFVARRWRGALLLTALGTYAVKILVLGVLLVSARDWEVVHPMSFAWSVLVGVFVWVAAELWVATHTRVPFYDPAAFVGSGDENQRRDRASS